MYKYYINCSRLTRAIFREEPFVIHNLHVWEGALTDENKEIVINTNNIISIESCDGKWEFNGNIFIKS